MRWLAMALLGTTWLGVPQHDPADEARNTLATAIEGMGGLETLREVRNLSVLSSATHIGEQGDLPVTSKLTVAGGNHLREDVVMSFGHLTMVYDGKQAFQVIGAEKAIMSDRDHALLRRRLSRSLPLLLVEAWDGQREIEYMGSSRESGSPLRRLRVTDRNGDGVVLSVDAATGRVLKLEYQTWTPERIPIDEVETRSDFRPLHGMVLPFHMTIHQGGRKVREVRIYDYGVNENLPEGLFDADKIARALAGPESD